MIVDLKSESWIYFRIMEITLKNRPDNHDGFVHVSNNCSAWGGGHIPTLQQQKCYSCIWREKSTPQVSTNSHSEPAPTSAPSTELISGFTLVANSVGNRSYTQVDR